MLSNSTKVIVLSLNSKHIEEIDNVVPDDLPLFRGTMKVHEVCWTINAPDILQMRRLSCITCSADEECKHYGLGKIQFPATADFHMSNCDRLHYED
ncbi:unnamed protein product [Acanthoscelides obtectus]|uniref:Uncharacterized protein n=1 Tax=Acanthoscelides obtectus TaxID=200917 RepID=A0A9P0PSP5_ACAOB|nr:unnamed protein product [Acanthoscelides obtectus]CAK1620082.1 hypothetical protein AOBTE_LOCUS184 [Acanthoscelides obtectus]